MRILGLDIGGTALKWGISEGEGLTECGTCPSRAKEGADRLLSCVFELLDGKRFDMLGVSTAGIVSEDGSIRYANGNIPNYTGVRLADILSERYGVPCQVLNDIAAAAYSERDGCRDYYYIAIGTGVAGVYVRDGVIMSGGSGIAGQIGYLPALRGGIIDEAASARGLNARSGGRAKELFALAEGGDTDSAAILDGWCDEIAHALMQVVGYVNPSNIVIGGGVSEQGEALLCRVSAALDRCLPVPYRNSFKLSCARGGNYAGVNGIINYVKDKENERTRTD